jgi:hypothetical protein
MKNFGLMFVNENNCILENRYFQMLPIVAFLIGFIVFKFIFGENTSRQEKNLKVKQSKEYLAKFQQENEEFFFGDAEGR